MAIPESDQELAVEAAMQSIVAATSAAPRHPTPEELLSYQAGELPDRDRDRVLRHLAACTHCTRAVLDVASFPEVEPADPGRRIDDAELARQWERFRARLRREEARPVRVARRGSWRASLFGSLRLAQAAAAVFLLVAVGLSVTLLSQRRPSPRVNLHLVELVPAQEAGRRTEDALHRVPPGVEGVVVSLALLDPRTYPAYEVLVTDSDGKARWRSSELRRSREGIFTLELPRGFLPAGRYRITVRGIADGRRELLATYVLNLEYKDE